MIFGFVMFIRSFRFLFSLFLAISLQIFGVYCIGFKRVWTKRSWKNGPWDGIVHLLAWASLAEQVGVSLLASLAEQVGVSLLASLAEQVGMSLLASLAEQVGVSLLASLAEQVGVSLLASLAEQVGMS